MKVFFFFGDSITLGVNVPQENGWVGRFAAGAMRQGLPVPPTTFYNLGVRKHSSQQVLERWQEEFSRRSLPGMSAYCLFCVGTVDMATPTGVPNVPLEESLAHTRRMLAQAGTQAAVLLMSPPPVVDAAHRERIRGLTRAQAALCQETGTPFLDIFAPLCRSEAYLADLADGIHPGQIGHALMAEYLLAHAEVKRWLTD